MAGGISGKLSEKAIKAFVSKAERGKKLADGGGLHLFITPAGGTTWRIKYRIVGKEKIYSVGPYPLVSLLSPSKWVPSTAERASSATWYGSRRFRST